MVGVMSTDSRTYNGSEAITTNVAWDYRSTSHPKHDGKHHIQHDCHSITREELTDLLKLPYCAPYRQPSRFEVGQRQRQEMTEQLRSQPYIDPIRGVANR